jgi:branched-chain amino acid transport system permease protein
VSTSRAGATAVATASRAAAWIEERAARIPVDSGYLLTLAGVVVFLLWADVVHAPRLPAEILILGLVFGSLNGLSSLGLVLIYRTNRVINFAQAEIGGVAAVLAAELILVRGWPALPSFAIALVTAAVAALLIERCVVRVFFNAPRLVLTVATIGVAQILAAIQLLMPNWFGNQISTLIAVPAPFSASFSVGVATFDGAAILALVVSPLLAAGLFFFLRNTMTGSAIRAAAEDNARARTLGIPVKRLSTLVWVLAGSVSGFAAILLSHVEGFAFGQLPGPGVLLRVLAPAAIARFDNLGVTFAAALGIGMADQGVFFLTGSNGTVDVMLFGVIVVALLVRGAQRGRSGDTARSAFAMLREVRPIPQRLQRWPEVRALRWGPGIVLAGMLLLLPQLLHSSQVEQAQTFLIEGMVGLSLVVLSGFAGQISLGQWAFSGVGAFAAARWYLAMQGHAVVQDFFVALAVAGLVGAVVCALVALPALRVGGYMLAVVTLGFAVVADNWLFTLDVAKLPAFIDRPSILGHFNGFDDRVYYYVCLAVFALCFLAVVNFRRSRRGRVLLAMRDNQAGGAAFGYSALRVKLAAFALSGFIAALAGGLFAFQVNALGAGAGASKAFLPEVSLALFAIVVFGGLGSPVGATLGAGFILGVQSLATDLDLQGLDLLATGIGILLLLYAAPGGIGQVVYDVRAAIVRAIVRRRERAPGAPPLSPADEAAAAVVGS